MFLIALSYIVCYTSRLRCYCYWRIMFWLLSLIFTFVILISIYYNLTKHYNHWKLQGIPTANGILPGFGHMLDVILLKKNYQMLFQDIYEAHPNHSMVGFYFLRKPALLIRHPEVLKQVLISEFSSFSDHVPLNAKTDPLLAFHAFFVGGETWKHTRRAISSAFTDSRLKKIVSILESESTKFKEFIDRNLSNGVEEFDVKDLFSKLITQILAREIFTIDAEALVEKDSPKSFQAIMDSLFLPSVWTAIKQNTTMIFPSLGWLFGINILPNWANKCFQKIVEDTREFKKSSPLRDDLLQHAIDYEQRNRWKGEDLVPAHAFSFFMDGYENLNLTLGALACLFAEYPKIQDIARDEVIRVLEKYGKLSYDAIVDMVYLEQCVKETLRIFPPLSRMQKVCTKPVTLEGSDGLSCSLQPGDQVFFTMCGLHKDPTYWTNPNEFNPDRFAKGNEQGQRKYVNMSFGDGPRRCPGVRVSFLHIKGIIALVLRKYSFEPSSRMKQSVTMIKIDPLCYLSCPVGSFWVNLKPL